MMKKAGLVLPILVCLACSGESGAGAEVVADASADMAGDVASDTAQLHDLAVDTVQPDSGPPAHLQVTENFQHPNCQADGPWEVDRTAMWRTPEQLENLDVLSILAAHDKLWVGTADGLYVLPDMDSVFEKVALPEGSGAVVDLYLADAGSILVGTGGLLVVLDAGGGVMASYEAQGAVLHVFGCGKDPYVVTAGELWILAPGGLAPVAPAPPAAPLGPGECLSGQVWMATSQGVYSLWDFGWKDEWTDTSDLPVVAMVERDGFMVAATLDVLAFFEDGALTETWVPGVGQLPTGEITSLALSDDGTLVALGHGVGTTLLHRDTGQVEYFHSLRWLPGEQVRDVALTPHDERWELWAATDAGAARLYKEDLWLEDKAERMLDQMNAWFWRMDGFVSANANFPSPWDTSSHELWDDDNDGQWTEEAVAAMCYAYAVTGDEKYYEAGKKAVTNMMMEIDVPAADFEAAGLGRGFITRSLVRDDEGAVFDSKATQDNWHLVDYEDGHQYYWKDDTSSDETTGHFYGMPLYFDLCAKTDEERALVAEHVTALAGYILDHGFTLPDLDGEPTEHGNWSPEMLAIAVDGLDVCVANGYPIVDCASAWGGGGFLDSLEILAAMVAAWHVSGEQRFLDAYETLIEDHRYDEVAMFNEDVVTWTQFGMANYCDHELADLAFLTLLRYDPNPERRQLWTKSMLEAWKHESGERNPVKSLAMAAVVGEVPGLENAVDTLVNYPEDLRMVLYDNTHRQDALPGPPDRHGDPQFHTVFPFEEIPVQRWDSNPYAAIGGGAPQVRRAPNFWLLPYWGLRYYGAICTEL